MKVKHVLVLLQATATRQAKRDYLYHAEILHMLEALTIFVA